MIGYCETPQFYSESFPVAQKNYRCVECSRPILKGDKHLRYAIKGGDDFFFGRQHLICRELCMAIRDTGLNNEECLAFGELTEFLSYGDNRDYPKEVRQLLAHFTFFRVKGRFPNFITPIQNLMSLK